MALIVVMSAGGSPGVTTTALSLALTWPAPVLMAECDPYGGAAAMGFLAGHYPAASTIVELALAAEQDPGDAGHLLAGHWIDLDADGHRQLLPGVRSPREGIALAKSWTGVADALAALDRDVIADVGRVGGPETPLPILAAADALILLAHPRMRSIAAAKPLVDHIRSGPLHTVPLMLATAGTGPYPAGQITKALGDIPLLAALPHLPLGASVLADGPPHRHRWRARMQLVALQRAAAGAGATLRRRHLDQNAPPQELAKWAAAPAAEGSRP